MFIYTNCGFDERTPLSDGEPAAANWYMISEGPPPLYWSSEFSVFASGGKPFWEI
jgi:hypothetical protein